MMNPVLAIDKVELHQFLFLNCWNRFRNCFSATKLATIVAKFLVIAERVGYDMRRCLITENGKKSCFIESE